MAQVKVKRVAEYYAKKEKQYQKGKKALSKCKGLKGKALDACLKPLGRKYSPVTQEWEKIRPKVKSSDVK